MKPPPRPLAAVAGLILAVVLMSGCAATDEADYNTEDLWRDYCATDAHQMNRSTRVTVPHWDPDRTTAGHRGTRTDPVLEPEANHPAPRGC